MVAHSVVLDEFRKGKGHSYSTGGSGMKFLNPQCPWGPFNVGPNDFFFHSFSGGEFVGMHMSQTGGQSHPVFTKITCN